MPQETDDLKKMVADLGQEVLSIRLTVDKIHRKMRWASLYGFIKFCVIFGPLIWAYFFFQPQIQEFYRIYGTMMQQFRNLESLQQMQGASNTNNEDLLKQLQQRYPQPKQ
jgi:hypothetical protein